MPSSRLSRFVQSMFLLATAVSFSGCGSLGSGLANSSGMGYYERGNFAAAASEFQMAMMNDPSNPDYMANFAKSRLKMGDVAGAEQYFRQALTIAPDHQPSYHGLAEMMVAQGRTQEAQAMLTTWAATQPYAPESHIELAWLQQELGNPGAAAQSLQQALEINPSHPTALAHMGKYYEEAGRPDQAVALYQNSLRSDWNQPEVHSRLASASQMAGPSSSMAATAMARGVHPYSVARQPSMFGPPSAGTQMAQMQVQQMQMQMAMSGSPYGNSAMMSPAQGQMAMSPMPSMQQATGQMAGFTPSYFSPSFGGATTTQVASAGPTPSGWQQAAPTMMMQTPAQTASNSSPSPDNFFPVPNPNGNMIFPMETVIQPSPSAAATPTPDAAFSSAAASPFSSISLSQSVTAQSPSVAGEPPLVEAF